MAETKNYKYLSLLINIFVVILIMSNLVAQKFVDVGWFTFSVAELFFPIEYIFGDVFTEVYGYGASRRAIWTGFLASGIATAYGLLAIWMPGGNGFTNQPAFEAIFGVVPRIVAGSLLAYCAGEFANSLTVAKMKIWTNGRYLWMRTIGSTIVGQLVDTSIVVIFIYWGRPPAFLLKLIISAYLFKVVYEVLATPLTYIVVNYLKKSEGVDYFDRKTNFNPFAAGA